VIVHAFSAALSTATPRKSPSAVVLEVWFARAEMTEATPCSSTSMEAMTRRLAEVTVRVSASGSTSSEAASLALKLAWSKASTVPAATNTSSTTSFTWMSLTGTPSKLARLAAYAVELVPMSNWAE
jgi:hypothetical protein